jgi:hypothetical protein
VPAGHDWVHEIKHDGYRLQVRRDGSDAVRLLPQLRLDRSTNPAKLSNVGEELTILDTLPD